MSLYAIKPQFQATLRPLVTRLARMGITANHLTVGALLLCAVVGGLIAWWPDQRWPLLLLPPCLLVRMALNAMDGMLAREHGQASPLGALLNELGDVLADGCLYLPLALFPGVSAVNLVVLVVLGLVGEFTGVLGPMVGASRHYEGPLGKADRALLLGLVALLLGFGISPGHWLDIVLGCGAFLAMLTIIRRLRGILREIAP